MSALRLSGIRQSEIGHEYACSIGEPELNGPGATRLMLRHKVGGLPVLDSGKLVGIVTTLDMLRAFPEVVETFEKTRSS